MCQCGNNECGTWKNFHSSSGANTGLLKGLRDFKKRKLHKKGKMRNFLDRARAKKIVIDFSWFYTDVSRKKGEN